MRIYLLFALLLLTGLTACHRDKTPAPKQYSTWIVNNHDTFTTNNVDSSVDCNPDHSYCIAGLKSKDYQNWFSMGFYLDNLPLSGQWPLGDYIQNPPDLSSYVFIYFYYQGKGGYIPTQPDLDTLYISSVNGKVSYRLNEMWFVNINNQSDSILIQGVFNVP